MTETQPATVPMTPIRRSRTLPLLVAAAVLVLVAAGVGAYLITTHRGDPLDRVDRAGAQACRDLRSWINGDLKDDQTGKPLDPLLAAMTFANEAIHSTTPAIRAAAGGNIMDGPAAAPVVANGGPLDFRVANLEQLHAACVSAGVSMPAYTEPVG